MGIGPVTLLLDTHVLLWWILDAPGLAPAQVEAIERAEAAVRRLTISAISLWEIAKLVERGRLDLEISIDVLFEEIEDHPSVSVLPLTSRVALESTRLGPGFPRDPADQIIAATARVHGLRLVTADERIRRSAVVSVV